MSDIKKVKGSKVRSDKNGVDREKKSNEKRVNSRKMRKNVHLDEFGTSDLLHDKKDFQKIRTHKIRKLVVSSEEQELDKVIENEDNISVTVMVIILVFCFVVGICLGYVLYQIAINSSNAMLIITHFLG